MQQISFFYSLHYHHINVIFQPVSSTNDCTQCAQYQEWIRMYTGIMTVHQKNHLHNLGTYVPECKQPNAGLGETKPPLSPTHAIHQPSMNHRDVYVSQYVHVDVPSDT